MQIFRRWWVIALIPVMLLGHGFATDKKQLAAAVAAVDANLKTKAGKDYDEKIGGEFSSKFVPSVRQCKQAAPASSLVPFDMLVRLDANGKMQEVLVYPENQLSLCTRTALLAGSFSPPPRGDYWVNIHMEIKH
jgi:hypothetical protein